MLARTRRRRSLLAQSIERFGWTVPVLIDAMGNIVGGHGRVLAAKQLGMTEVPVITLGEMSEADRRAYVLADNKIAQLSGWDDEMLRAELADLKALNYEVKLTGFSDDEIATLMDGWTVPDKAVKSHGSHTDAIPATLRVIVPAEQEQAARKVITEALTAAAIQADVK